MEHKEIRIEYSTVDTAMTPCTLNKVQYPADREVNRVTWFQEMMAQVPKSGYPQCLTATKNM